MRVLSSPIKGISYTSNALTLAISVAALSLIASFMVGYYDKVSLLSENREASIISLEIQKGLLELEGTENGYVEVALPERVFSKPYRISLSSNSVILNVEGREIKERLPFLGIELGGQSIGSKVKLVKSTDNGKPKIFMESMA